MKINIAGLNKADVLAALYNRAQPLGMGFLEYDPKPMSAEEAQAIINERTAVYSLTQALYFDYLKGRVMKVDLSGDEFGPSLYDRDNGEGAAASVVDELRKSQSKAA